MTIAPGTTSTDRLHAPASLDVYQAAVRRLTAELKDCQAQLAGQQETQRREAARIRAQLNEGLTPELLELKKSLSRWRSRAQAAELRLRENRRTGGVQ